MPKLRAVPGFVGAYPLERDVDDEVEFVVQTLWESAEAALVRRDATVSHHAVLDVPGEE